MATNEGVTHVVDARTIKDPVGDSNDLRQQVSALFGANPPREAIKRAPIYDQATGNAGAAQSGLQRSDNGNTDGGSQQRRVQEDSVNIPDHYSGDYDQYAPSLDLSEPGEQQQTGGQNIDLGDFLRPTAEEQQRPAGTEQPAPEQQQQVADFERFKSDFEKHLGIPLEGAVQTIQQLQQFQAQQTSETRLRQIADNWGVNRTEAEARMQAVDDRFRRLNPQTRAILAQDPIQGAQLIWQQLERESVYQTPQVPQLDRSGTAEKTAQRPRGSYTKAEIAAMDNETYRRNQAQIVDAYRRGLVFDY